MLSNEFEKLKGSLVQALELKQEEREERFRELMPALASLFKDAKDAEPVEMFQALRAANLLPMITQTIFSPDFQGYGDESDIGNFTSRLIGLLFDYRAHETVYKDIELIVLPALQYYLEVLKNELPKLQQLSNDDILPLPKVLSSLVKEYSTFNLFSLNNNLKFLFTLYGSPKYFNNFSLFNSFAISPSIKIIAINTIVESIMIWHQLLNSIDPKNINKNDKDFIAKLTSHINDALSNVPIFQAIPKEYMSSGSPWVNLDVRKDIASMLSTIDDLPANSRKYWLPALKNFFDALSQILSYEFSAPRLNRYYLNINLLALDNAINKFSFNNEEKALKTAFEVESGMIKSSAKHPILKIREELDLIVKYHNEARKKTKSQQGFFNKESNFANYMHHLFFRRLVQFQLMNNQYAEIKYDGYELKRNKSFKERLGMHDGRPLGEFWNVKINYKDALDVNEFWNEERFPLLRAYAIYDRLMQLEQPPQPHARNDDGGAAYRGP